MKKNIILAVLCLGLLPGVHARDTVRLSLAEAIHIGTTRSVNAVVAENEYVASYWTYRTYKTELLPEVTLTSTLPYYSKAYNTFQNSDGSYTYVSNNYNRIDAGLSVSQNIPWTGGKISLGSSFQRLQQNGTSSSVRYKSVPAFITLSQPLFGYNRVKWLQRIEPVKYEVAKKTLVSDMEEVANLAVQYYFNLLLGEINLEIAQQNLRNAEKLYAISQAKYNIGQLSETDLMQMHVSLLKAESSMTDARASLDSRMFDLRSFLGYGEGVVLEPSIPEFITEDIPVLTYRDVLELARENNAFTHNIQRQMLEASRNVSQAKADRWNATLYVSFGMSGQDRIFRESYNPSNWVDDQTLSLGLSIPLIDWGKGRGKVETARANKRVSDARIETEQIKFDQNIFLRVQNFNNQPKQLTLARETDKIAQKRYDTSVEMFTLGKIDILNLNDSQTSKDAARRNYIEQMYLLWSYYYQIRALTLFDFIGGVPITADYSL